MHAHANPGSCGADILFTAASCYNAPMPAKKTQLERFKEAAREVETDNDKARFEAMLGKIAAPKPPTKPVKKSKMK
jgi:hypothetical protein